MVFIDFAIGYTSKTEAPAEWTGALAITVLHLQPFLLKKQYI